MVHHEVRLKHGPEPSTVRGWVGEGYSYRKTETVRFNVFTFWYWGYRGTGDPSGTRIKVGY